MGLDFSFRALPVWPYPRTQRRRGRYTFKASWSQTLDLLERELRLLDAYDLVIGAGFKETDLRMDGMPRANAGQPLHPGVELSFTTRRLGRLVYRTDVCEFWQHNVRSIALGLEALRAVDRYDITTSGQQYAGFRQIEATTGVRQATLERGRALISEHGSVRAAQVATHPDMPGGDAIDFQSVTIAKEGIHV